MSGFLRVADTRRIAKFALVGVTGMIVNTAVLYLGHDVGQLPLLIASVLAVETAILNNFLWNNLWTFSQRDFTWERLAKFNLVSLGGLVITVTILYALVQWFGLYYLVANLLAISVATGWNFMINSIWTWGSVT
ncbi:MAG: GtrA family protein [Chloroflexota bacterium]